MTSLVPYLMPALAQSRMEEQLAAAERMRLMRTLRADNGTMRMLRRVAGATLVRVGEWLTPARRESTEPVTDPALIRLAR